MKVLILTLALVAIGQGSLKPQERAKVIEPDRYLVVQNHGVLSEFQHIWLGEIKAENGLQIRGKAYIGGIYIDLRGTIQDQKLTFLTAPYKGFSYRFTGRFLEVNDPDNLRTPVLEGSLSKETEGKHIASANIEFTIGKGWNK